MSNCGANQGALQTRLPPKLQPTTLRLNIGGSHSGIYWEERRKEYYVAVFKTLEVWHPSITNRKTKGYGDG
jgi:hypothetical protein